MAPSIGISSGDISTGSALGTGGGLKPAARTMAADGDSLTAQYLSTVLGGYTQTNSRAWPFWARTLSRQRVYLPTANIKAVSGSTSAQVRARTAGMVATGAAIMALLIGTNSIAAGVSAVDVDADIAATVADYRASGAIVVLLNVYPRGAVTGGLTSGQVIELKALRDRIRARHSPATGVYVADAWNALAVAPDSETPAAGVYWDGIHTTPKGAAIVGQIVSDTLALLLSPAEPWDVGGASLCLNAAVAGTAGTKTAGLAGSVATSWDGYCPALTGDQAVTASKVTSGEREWQQFAFSGSGWASSASLGMQQTMAGWGSAFNIGDTVSLAFDFEIDAGQVGINSINAGIIYKAGSTIYDGRQLGTAYEFDNASRTGIIRIDRFTLPADATRVVPGFSIWLNGGAGSGIVRIAHPHLIKH